MRRCGMNNLSLFLVFLVTTVLWNEFLSYQFTALWWSSSSVPSQPDEIRFLLVADPQLIGYHNDPWYISPLSRWDSDRYLVQGFSRAVNSVKPHALIFLGDLFDEGLESDENQFKDTVDRFRTIFSLNKDSNKVFDTIVFVSGDNDVGGEREPVLPHLQRRFEQSFQSFFSQSAKWSRLMFSQVNLFEPNPKNRPIFTGNNSNLHILLSHVPVLPIVSQLKERTGDPDLVLSAHDHSAKLTSEPRQKSSRSPINRDLTGVFHSLTASLGLQDDHIHEFQVPTCSYRMGTYDVGYASMLLRSPQNGDNKFEAEFAVLWMPCRFYHFIIYGFSMLMYLTLIVVLASRSFSRRSFRYFTIGR